MAERLSEEQIKAARQVTLLDYLLRHEPDLVVRVGNAYRTPRGHSSLTISVDGTKWHWFAGQVGGRSALDYLAKVESCQINAVPWTKLPVISLSGTAPAAILQYLRDSPDTDVVYLALDNDEAGRQGVQRIAKAIEADAKLSAQVKRIISALPSPAYGKDYNEMLQTLQRENTICRKHRTETRQR